MAEARSKRPPNALKSTGRLCSVTLIRTDEMTEHPAVPDAPPDATETTDVIFSKIAADLHAAGVRADVAAVLKETVFSDEQARASDSSVIERLLDLPENAP